MIGFKDFTHESKLAVVIWGLLFTMEALFAITLHQTFDVVFMVIFGVLFSAMWSAAKAEATRRKLKAAAEQHDDPSTKV